MKKARFAFGKTGIEVMLPVGPVYQTIEGRMAPPLEAVEAALEERLDFPVAGPSLAQLARGKRSAAIAVCDITRPVPNRILLPPILKRLREAGVPASSITIFIATGLHRPASPEEIRQIVGPEIAGSYRVVNHNAHAGADHRFLGTTKRGTPVYLETAFLDADLHLTIGFIEQHLMLGFSGGRKLIAPGLAGEATIKTIHSPRFMREPMAVEGSIEQNPLHEELLEIASMARHDFIVDVTMTRDRQISGIFTGAPREAHAAGVEFLRRTSLERLVEPVDAVITSAAGYPLDMTFYQSIKGVTAAHHLVKPGGSILVLGECSEGVGSPQFSRMLRSFEGYESYLEQIRDTDVVADQWQLEKLALVGREYELFFFTPGVRSGELGAIGSRTFPNLGDAVAALMRSVPPGGRVALIPEGPYVFAQVDRGSIEPAEKSFEPAEKHRSIGLI